MGFSLRPLLWLLAWTLLAPRTAHAEATTIRSIEWIGLSRTRVSTLQDLLPRAPPAQYSEAELAELSRRISNLEVFDSVAIRVEGERLVVEVREKWTLIPEFDLATGTTLRDTYVLLGVTEENFLGLASELSLNVFREQRGFGFYLSFEEHVYQRKRWSIGAETSYSSADFRFRDGASWAIREGFVYVWTTSTPLGSDHARLELGARYGHQTVTEFEGDVRPKDGNSLLASAMLTWDDYTWHDLVPRGFRVNVSVAPGMLIKKDRVRKRGRVDLELRASQPLWRHAALMGYLWGAVLLRNQPVYTQLLGSAEGVRGLTDALYFNWAQVYTNIELRQAVPLGKRWALQFVAFADTAFFARMDSRGHHDKSYFAFSGGGGVRVLPTWLANIVPRFDVARLVSPERSVFYQFGLSQYF